MISNIASSAHFDHLYTFSLQGSRVRHNISVTVTGTSTNRKHMGMLQKKKQIWNFSSMASFHELLLQKKRFVVRNTTKSTHLKCPSSLYQYCMRALRQLIHPSAVSLYCAEYSNLNH
jgi:hypothetical protein